MIKRVWICYIEHYDAAVRAFVVAGSHMFEFFLTCCIPNLQSDFCAIVVKLFQLEIDPDCGHMFIDFGVFGVFKHQGGLSSSGIADYDDFEEVIV